MEPAKDAVSSQAHESEDDDPKARPVPDLTVLEQKIKFIHKAISFASMATSSCLAQSSLNPYLPP
jgi:hypothetical protein